MTFSLHSKSTTLDENDLPLWARLLRNGQIIVREDQIDPFTLLLVKGYNESIQLKQRLIKLRTFYCRTAYMTRDAQRKNEKVKKEIKEMIKTLDECDKSIEESLNLMIATDQEQI